MKLKVKFLKWSAGVPIAMLTKDTAIKLGAHINERISIKAYLKYSRELSMPVNIVEGLLKNDEIAISYEIKKRLGLKKGQFVEVQLAESPLSLKYIKKKLNKNRLSKQEIERIIKEIVDNDLSEAEISLFISAIYLNGLTLKETSYLIKSILKYGNILKLKEKLIADKHCIGGIPGNRTTPIVISICAAAGLTMPKSSSRAITSAAGTADVIEVLSPVSFSSKELKSILKKTNAFLVWGGGLEMVPADSRIINIEKRLKIDPDSQLLASIISKKLAVNSKYILIDIPYGKNAKVTKKKALILKTKFEKIGKYFGRKIKVILTRGDEPIGNGVGPVLEMMDVLKVLDPHQKGPKDLEEKSILLAGKIFEMTGKEKNGKGIQRAKSILDSGKAFEKFRDIIKAQG